MSLEKQKNSSLVVGPKKYFNFLGCFGEMGGEWICLGVVDLLGIIIIFCFASCT